MVMCCCWKQTVSHRKRLRRVFSLIVIGWIGSPRFVRSSTMGLPRPVASTAMVWSCSFWWACFMKAVKVL